MKHIAEKRMAADCVGLIKAFFWSSNGTTASKYGVNNCPDRSANGMFSLCKKTGSIGTIPNTPGLVVWSSGHIGVSIDGVWAIEARGFNYGVVKTRIKDRKWTKWGQLPSSMLDYVESSDETTQPENPDVSAASCPYEEPVRNLKKGAKGGGVKWIQWMLEACGYSVGKCGIDGDFGSATRSAVRKFQKAQSLSVDGIVGPLTRKELKAAFAARN